VPPLWRQRGGDAGWRLHVPFWEGASEAENALNALEGGQQSAEPLDRLRAR
jgi:hypothetical protein